ncbi:PD-(D/E)XK nuclease-like domain-containing protein [Methylococcus mesophilus]|uniref:PD-(D/E)XK nuclease-like domain-containing protein n=1 Tax=Methylococcus mesophilus TaxID=2993564 RepID=UPI00224A76A8|nr:PD-(D/E)XK nuclease-like domain-containing protein [Methylococcus mesophilus]UZR29038.1 PD-(D/E)XK nuclease-like domain-containing protein [Methylococcus mesophilus]
MNDQLAGIAYGLPAATYHSDPAVSKSGLDRLAKSPAHYRWWLENREEPTKALILGTAIHTAVLEPDELRTRYAFMLEGLDRRTKEGKAIYAELESGGRTVLSADDEKLVTGVMESVQLHPTASELLRGGEGMSEVSCFTELEGLNVKCRPDWLRRDGIVVDLKTTEDASPRGFARSVANYRYQVQAAYYLDCLAATGLSPHTFVFIAVEKSDPHAVGIYELDAEALELGRELYRRDLALLKHCLATDEWPGYSEDVVSLNVPAWAYAQAA